MIDTPAASGPALFTALYKVLPEDFRVSEVLDIEMDGTGEHLYLHIEKTATNTDEVAGLLEKTCQLTSADIGVSGMKDRHAITRQWFSVRTPLDLPIVKAALDEFNRLARLQADAIPVQAGGDGDEARAARYCKQLTLLDSARHTRKLRRGAHRGNDFVVVLRDVQPRADSSRMAVEQRIAQLASTGFPNYLGPQRFGAGGQNLARARQWFKTPRKRTSRQQRSLWLSAARSELFNAICAARVKQDSWQRLLEGEPAVLDGSRSFFDSASAPRQELEARLADFDIHPSAAWWGRGPTLAQGECADFEQQVLCQHADLCAGLERSGLTQERRALRATVGDLRYAWQEDRTLELRFRLSPGVFATTMLAELGRCNEPAR